MLGSQESHGALLYEPVVRFYRGFYGTGIPGYSQCSLSMNEDIRVWEYVGMLNMYLDL